MKCPRCKADISDDSRFCDECGTAIPLGCPSCGASNRPDAKFCKECGCKLSSRISAATPAPWSAPPPASSASTAERRHLTVMFCDLVGSTALAARMDPEDLREVIGAYQKCVRDTISRFDGFVAKYMGDGVLMYFGYPQAHEDDPERAVRAGLALVDAVTELPLAPTRLQVRIGIGTGLVVVGDLVGSGEAQERGVVGETPNLAARLQAFAEPGTIVIGPSTRRLLGDLFEYRDLGTVEVKGYAEPVNAYEVLRPSAVESRFEALHAAALTPLVSRDEEIELLLRRWQRAQRGEGQVVLLSGEPGIGKSRVTVALQERLSAEPHTRLRYFCSAQHTNSALYPTVSQLERAAGLERNEAPEAKLDKLEGLLAPTALGAEDTALIAELLSLPTTGRYTALALTPQRRKERTFEALLRYLDSLARQRPVLMIYEDVHWIDPSSHELLDLIVEQVARLPVLLLATFRPEFQPPWTGQAHVTALVLKRLDRREGAALVERIVGKNALPDNIVARIIERTDGVPLFAEELTKAVLETGGTEAHVQLLLSRTASAALAVPTTLHASLMARLDHLGAAAKEGAQIGAVIGREFSYDLLAAVTPRSERELRTALDQLVEAGLVFRRGTPPQATFAFKHALVQDAAYASLLRATRQELHARIAQTLEARFPDAMAMQPELVARHLTEAGLSGPAIAYWQRAGERATARSANLEAVAHFRRGLELLEALPDRAARADQELLLLIAYGPALMTTRSSTAPEIGRLYSRARELARETGQSAELFPTVWGSWLVAWSHGDIPTAGRLADELFVVARAHDDPELMLQAYHAAWPMGMTRGDFDEAWRQVEAGLALYRREAHAHHARLYGGHDPGTCGYVIGALMRVATGYPEHAIELIEKGLALARDLAHPPNLAHALWFAAEVRQIRREPKAVEELAARLIPLVSEHGSAVGVANAMMLRGWARTMQGDVDQGLAELRKGLAAWRATGSKFHVAYRLARAVDACRVAGLTAEGLSLLAEALDVAEESGERWFLAELHRLRGELLVMSSRGRGEAEANYQRAQKVARRQGAHLWELRAATSLARLWQAQGKRRQARDLLAPVYDWFTEGFTTSDLTEAKALLGELRE